MEISEKEYFDLQIQVRSLQEQVNSLSVPRKTSLAGAVSAEVLSRVTNIVDDKPIFGYSASCNNDVWTLMMQLAKTLHTPSDFFYMDKGCNHRPYIRSTHHRERVKKIADMTDVQFGASVEMLNEIVPIYNKYFKKMHQNVWYDATGQGDYQSIPVIDNMKL